jgi:hypothetical protein
LLILVSNKADAATFWRWSGEPASNHQVRLLVNTNLG